MSGPVSHLGMTFGKPSSKLSRFSSSRSLLQQSSLKLHFKLHKEQSHLFLHNFVQLSTKYEITGRRTPICALNPQFFSFSLSFSSSFFFSSSSPSFPRERNRGIDLVSSFGFAPRRRRRNQGERTLVCDKTRIHVRNDGHKHGRRGGWTGTGAYYAHFDPTTPASEFCYELREENEGQPVEREREAQRGALSRGGIFASKTFIAPKLQRFC